MSNREFTRLRRLTLAELINEPIDKLQQLNINLAVIVKIVLKKGVN